MVELIPREEAIEQIQAWAVDLNHPQYLVREDAIYILESLKAGRPKIGRWVKTHGGITPGGTPVYVCGNCGGSEHLHGVEYRKRKVFCDKCGQVNVYPWEEILEDESNG